MELIVILIWIGTIFGCYTIALDKNRSTIGWVLAGLFFGVFALILLAILRPLPKSLEL